MKKKNVTVTVKVPEFTDVKDAGKNVLKFTRDKVSGAFDTVAQKCAKLALKIGNKQVEG